MTDYDKVKATFIGLCVASGLPRPRICEAEATDPCDVTDAEYVRLNCKVAEGCTDAFHAAHVFGHWLCDLHGAESYEEPTREGFEGVSDKVADFLASVLLDTET